MWKEHDTTMNRIYVGTNIVAITIWYRWRIQRGGHSASAAIGLDEHAWNFGKLSDS